MTLKFKTTTDKAGDVVFKRIAKTLKEFQGFYDIPMEVIRDGNDFTVTNLSSFMVKMIKEFDLKIK